MFRSLGDYWTIVHEGKTLQLRDTRGLRYIRFVLERPETKVPVLDLVAAGQTTRTGRGSALAAEPGNAEHDGRGAEHEQESEKARQSVRKAIKAAIEKIVEIDPSLGYHLSTSIRTGRCCSYRPDPRHRVHWEF